MRRAGQEILTVLGLSVLFVAVAALVLWPMGRAALALSLGKGYAVFWAAVWVSVLLLGGVERALRLDPDTHYRSYVAVNLMASAFLVAGWAAFAALGARDFAAGASAWTATVLYTTGFLSSYLAFVVATAFYRGGVYKVVDLPLALAGYLVFAAWPAAGRAAYGWLFSLFG